MNTNWSIVIILLRCTYVNGFLTLLGKSGLHGILQVHFLLGLLGLGLDGAVFHGLPGDILCGSGGNVLLRVLRGLCGSV